MSNIQNIDISLQEIVKKIEKNTYLIPKFQRDFVWKTKDICDLGDSIMRGYPISSLLIMAANGSLNIGADILCEGDIKDKEQNRGTSNESKLYILDGQQRLTSIAYLFLNFDTKNEYYFDLLSILLDKFPEDKIEKNEWIKRDFIIPSSGDFCRNFKLSNDGSEKSTRQNNQFISGKNIIEDRFGSVVNKFLRNFTNNIDGDKIDKYTDHLNAVLGSISGYSIPATVIASDAELGIVIRVFEKVNSTGKKLTLFDLINAKSYEKHRTGLSAHLTEEIKKILHQRSNFAPGTKKFLKYNENKESFAKLDKIIRILEIQFLLSSGSLPSIFKSTMLTREPDFWFDAWNKNCSRIIEIFSWMDDEGLIDVGQTTFLEYATSIFLANPKSFESARFKKEIRKYALYLTLTGNGFSKSNFDTVEKLFNISKHIAEKHESEKHNYTSPSGNPNLTADDVLGITTAHSKFEAITNIFYNDNINGLFTVDICGNSIRRTELKKLDRHHIFPKSRVSNFNAKSKFNSIANIVLIDSASNREHLKDKSPKEYFSKIGSDKNGIHACKQNIIDFETAMQIEHENDGLDFISKRAKDIAETINSYFD